MSSHQCLKPSYILEIQWNLHMTFPESTVPFISMHTFQSPTKTPTRTSNLPGIYIYVFYPIHQLHIQILQTISCCCHMKYYNRNSGKRKGFSVTFPNSSTPFVYTYCSMPSRLHQQIRTVHSTATAWHSSKNLAYDPPGRYNCLWTAVAWCTYLPTHGSTGVNQSRALTVWYFFFINL